MLGVRRRPLTSPTAAKAAETVGGDTDTMTATPAPVKRIMREAPVPEASADAMTDAKVVPSPSSAPTPAKVMPAPVTGAASTSTPRQPLRDPELSKLSRSVVEMRQNMQRIIDQAKTEGAIDATIFLGDSYVNQEIKKYHQLLAQAMEESGPDDIVAAAYRAEEVVQAAIAKFNSVLDSCEAGLEAVLRV